MTSWKKKDEKKSEWVGKKGHCENKYSIKDQSCLLFETFNAETFIQKEILCGNCTCCTFSSQIWPGLIICFS